MYTLADRVGAFTLKGENVGQEGFYPASVMAASPYGSISATRPPGTPQSAWVVANNQAFCDFGHLAFNEALVDLYVEIPLSIGRAS
jgi:hypothetical protein